MIEFSRHMQDFEFAKNSPQSHILEYVNKLLMDIPHSYIHACCCAAWTRSVHAAHELGVLSPSLPHSCSIAR